MLTEWFPVAFSWVASLFIIGALSLLGLVILLALAFALLGALFDW